MTEKYMHMKVVSLLLHNSLEFTKRERVGDLLFNYQALFLIELSADWIHFATHNPELNDSHTRSPSAPSGDFTPCAASHLSSTCKGCDEVFVPRLLAFRAQTVVYVDCSVHTQARTSCRSRCGRKGRVAEAVADGKGEYVPVSLKHFDLFPQIAHAESSSQRAML